MKLWKYELDLATLVWGPVEKYCKYSNRSSVLRRAGGEVSKLQDRSKFTKIR
jgi:hypothetical protein